MPGEALKPPVASPIGQIGVSPLLLSCNCAHSALLARTQLQTCYDVRFPEAALALRRRGAECLTYPSAFTQRTGAAHWELLLRARAVDTQCWVLAAAQVGKSGLRAGQRRHADAQVHLQQAHIRARSASRTDMQ